MKNEVHRTQATPQSTSFRQSFVGLQADYNCSARFRSIYIRVFEDLVFVVVVPSRVW